MRPGSVNVWGVAIAASSGGVLDILAATVYHLPHDHWRLPSADLLPQLIASLVVCALLFAWVAFAHDRTTRHKEHAPGSGGRAKAARIDREA